MKAFSETIVLLLVCGVVNAVTDEVMTVMEGESVTLDTGVTELKKDNDQIVWRFVEGDNKTLLVKVFKNNITDVDERFKDRLQTQIGSITIKNMKTKFAGSYTADIQDGTGTPIKNFSIIVKASQHVSADGTCKVKSMSVMEVETVTLNTDDKLQNDTLGGLSALEKIGIAVAVAVVLLTSAVGIAAVIYYHKYLPIYLSIPKLQEVYEGENVPLTVPNSRSDAVIEWIFGDNDVIARLNKKNGDVSTYSGADERFRDRLDLNEQTGDLTINNIKTRHSGLYKLKISTSTRVSSTFQFNVIVKARIISAELGRRVTLDIGINNKLIKEKDEILWMFGAKDIRIARFSEGKDLFYNYPDERFNDNLEIDKQTRSLTIKDLTPKNTGAYQVQILRSGETEYKKFYVTVLASAKVGKSVTLDAKDQIKIDGRVKWIFDNKFELVTGKNGDDRETKYTKDKRFRGRLKMNSETGDLTIKKIKKTDDGIYKLQHTVISDRSDDVKISYRKFTVKVSARGEDVNSDVMMPLLNP